MPFRLQILRGLTTLQGLSPSDGTSRTSAPDRFIVHPVHRMPGPNIWIFTEIDELICVKASLALRSSLKELCHGLVGLKESACFVARLGQMRTRGFFEISSKVFDMRLFLLANTVMTICFFSVVSGASASDGILHSRADLPSGDRVLLAGNAASDQVTSKIVITERKRRGEEMEVRYRVEFDNVPHGKKYRLYLLTGYMQKNGLPEIDVSKQFGLFTPDSRGRIVHGYGFVLYKGEWVRMRLRSVDGSIEKAFKFILFK